MISTIAFDADDTLWHNEILYTDVKKKFAQIYESDLAYDEVAAVLDDTEIHNLQYWGYGIKSFCLSMIETAINISDGKLNSTSIHSILSYTKEMLMAEVQLFDHTESTLAALKSSYDLMLITKGDSFEQDGKIQRSGISDYFKYIEIVPDKTETIYRIVLDKYNIAPETFLMVGNSIRSDILPVTGIGGSAVHIPYHGHWNYEDDYDQEALKSSSFHTIEDISDLPPLLDTIAVDHS